MGDSLLNVSLLFSPFQAVQDSVSTDWGPGEGPGEGPDANNQISQGPSVRVMGLDNHHSVSSVLESEL